MPKPAQLLQADKSETTLLVFFIPSADREGDALGKKVQRRWVRKALKLLGETLGGATAFPRGWGVWRDDAQGGRLVWDRPVLIQCFTSESTNASIFCVSSSAKSSPKSIAITSISSNM